MRFISRWVSNSAPLLVALALAASAAAASPEEMTMGARKTLDELAGEYARKSPRAFLRLLSNRFLGDTNDVEDALRRDFDSYLSVRFDISEAKPQVKDDQVAVPFHYVLSETDAMGKTRRIEDDTEFDFIWEDGRAKLYFMRSPMPFGRPPGDRDLETAAKETMREMAQDYGLKMRSAFMRLVSDEYLGNRLTLEDALVADFRTYRTVELQTFIDNITVKGQLVNVDFHYNLSVIDNTGAPAVFQGTTNFQFRWERGGAKLFQMSLPIIFGNSLPQAQNPIPSSQNSSKTSGTAPGAANPPPPPTGPGG